MPLDPDRFEKEIEKELDKFIKQLLEIVGFIVLFMIAVVFAGQAIVKLSAPDENVGDHVNVGSVLPTWEKVPGKFTVGFPNPATPDLSKQPAP